MIRKLKKLILVVCMMLFFVPIAVQAAETENIVILYTNDVHTHVDNNGIRYSKIAALKDTFTNALLLDAGDHIQGTAYGSMDKGETIIKLMNAAGYDGATLGNHEFDYGMSGCEAARGWADYPYLSCNFYHEENGVAGETVLDSYKIYDVNGAKIAVIGITTPESFKSSTPAYFQDANGNYIYGIAGGEDGTLLYASVQKAIDAAKEEADYIIALGHLGDDTSSAPWRSEDVIANTTGLDAFIDGHSHSTVPMKRVSDKNGETVILTQTGEYLNAVGKMTISGNEIKTELLTAADLDSISPDSETKAIEDNWIQELENQLGQKIGTFEVTFDNYDTAGARLVRKQETNSGDFSADALYYLFDHMNMDVDVAIMNGGGVRNKALTGGVTYKNCKEIHTFGNIACLQTVTGQQILDALEWGARSVGLENGEEGCFLQVSGITYKIDTTIPSTVQKDDKGVWTGKPTGAYRVHDVKVYNKETNTWDALNLSGKYNLAGYNYILRNLGDGFAMFDGAVNVLDYVMEDYLVLANYVQAFENGVVKADNSPLTKKYDGFAVNYGTVNGSGRIVNEKQIQYYPIWIGGVQISEVNHSGDGWNYDADTNTLYLDQYTYEGAGYKNAGIYTDKDLNLVLSGENNIKCSKFYGICVKQATLSVSGEGSLHVEGSDYGIFTSGWNVGALTIKDHVKIQAVSGDVVSGSSYGIRADGAFVIKDDAEVTGKAGYAPQRSCGIYAYTTLDICDRAIVTAIGGNGTASDIEVDSYGIRTTNMTVSGGNLTATAGTARYASCGIYTQTLKISGGVVTSKGNATLEGPSIGIQAIKSLQCSDCQVEAVGGDASANDDTSCGIQSGGSIVVSSGTIQANAGMGGYMRGIQAGSLEVTGGTISAMVTDVTDSTYTPDYSIGIQLSDKMYVSDGIIIAKGSHAQSYSYGIQSAGGVTISGGKITGTSGNAQKSFGMWIFGQMDMTGGNLELTAGESVGNYGLRAGIYVVNGSITIAYEKMTARTAQSESQIEVLSNGPVYAESGITVDEKLDMDHKSIQTVELSAGTFYTIMDANGTTIAEVVQIKNQVSDKNEPSNGTITPTPTPGATETPSVTPTPGATETPSVTPTPGVTETPSATPTPEVTEKPSATPGTENTAPKSGDSSCIQLWVVVMAVSGIVMLEMKKKKRCVK